MYIYISFGMIISKKKNQDHDFASQSNKRMPQSRLRIKWKDNSNTIHSYLMVLIK